MSVKRLINNGNKEIYWFHESQIVHLKRKQKTNFYLKKKEFFFGCSIN